MGGTNGNSIAQGKKLDIDPLTGDVIVCGAFSRTVDFDPVVISSTLLLSDHLKDLLQNSQKMATSFGLNSLEDSIMYMHPFI